MLFGFLDGISPYSGSVKVVVGTERFGFIFNGICRRRDAKDTLLARSQLSGFPFSLGSTRKSRQSKCSILLDPASRELRRDSVKVESCPLTNLLSQNFYVQRIWWFDVLYDLVAKRRKFQWDLIITIYKHSLWSIAFRNQCYTWY